MLVYGFILSVKWVCFQVKLQSCNPTGANTWNRICHPPPSILWYFSRVCPFWFCYKSNEVLDQINIFLLLCTWYFSQLLWLGLSVLRNDCQGAEWLNGCWLFCKVWFVYRITEGNLRSLHLVLSLKFAVKCSHEFQNLSSQECLSYVFTFSSRVWDCVWVFKFTLALSPHLPFSGNGLFTCRWKYLWSCRSSTFIFVVETTQYPVCLLAYWTPWLRCCRLKLIPKMAWD